MQSNNKRDTKGNRNFEIGKCLNVRKMNRISVAEISQNVYGMFHEIKTTRK